MPGPVTSEMSKHITGRVRRRRPIVMVLGAIVLFVVATIGRCIAVNRCEDLSGTWDNSVQGCILPEPEATP